MNVHNGVVFAVGIVLGASLVVNLGATGQPAGGGKYGAIAVKGVTGNEDIAIIDTDTGQVWRRFGATAIDMGTPNDPKNEVLNLPSKE